MYKALLGEAGYLSVLFFDMTSLCEKKKKPSLEDHIPPLIVHAVLRALTGLSSTSLKYTLPLVVLIGGVDLCVLLLVKNNHSSGHYSCCTSSFNWCNARRNESEGGPQKQASE